MNQDELAVWQHGDHYSSHNVHSTGGGYNVHSEKGLHSGLHSLVHGGGHSKVHGGVHGGGHGGVHSSGHGG